MEKIIATSRLSTLCWSVFNFFLIMVFLNSLFLPFPTWAGLEFVETIQDGQGQIDGLNAAMSVTTSPDDKFVYAVGAVDNAITVFIRNPVSGKLVLTQILQENIDGVIGLADPRSVKVSADGKSVYVASWYDSAVAVFSRDPSNGQLTFQQALINGQKDGQTVVDGLGRAVSVTVSTDGKSVYVAGNFDNAVTVFSRDPSNGRLTFQQALKNSDIGMVDKNLDSHSVTVSADSQSIYVVSSANSAIAMLKRDSDSGKLNSQQVIKNGDDNGHGGVVDGLASPNSVTVSADGKSVYVTSWSDNAVAVFSRDLSSGQLAFKQVIKDGDDGGKVNGLVNPNSVTVSADGKSVYVTSYFDSAVAWFLRKEDGQLSFQKAFINGQAGVDGLNTSRSVTVSADGQSVYVASSFTGAVAVFSRDPSSGQLTWEQALKDGDNGIVDGLNWANSVTVSTDGKSVYVAGYGESAIATFLRDPSTGQLTFQQVLKDGDSGVVDGLAGVCSVTISTDGQSVYVASYHDNAVAVFNRDKVTGQLTFQQVIKDGDDDGHGDKVDGLARACSVTVSADGKSVYVTDSFMDDASDKAIAVFARDLDTGRLGFLQVIRNGDQDGKVTGLSGTNIHSVTVSPDGKSVYVTSYSDNAVVVFKRFSDGHLEFQQAIKNGDQIIKNGDTGIVNELQNPFSVTVSVDGKLVYVTSGSGMVVFTRNPSDGLLTSIRQVLKGVSGAYSVATSIDDQSIYVANYNASAVAEFVRDPDTDYLTFVKQIKYGDFGIKGLRQASSVIVSPDNQSVYVTGLEDNALVVFNRTNYPPINTLPPPPTLQKNTPTTLNLDLADDDAGLLPLQVTLIATNGTLTLNHTSNLTFNSGDGQDDSQLVIVGKLADLKAALQGITFTPTPNFNGEASLEMISDDLGHTGSSAKQDQDKMTFTVAFSNAKPVVEKIATQYGSPGQLLQLPIKATDSDIPQQLLNYHLEDPPTGATIGYRNGQFNWTPSPEQLGTFKIQVIVNDGIDDSEPLTFQVIITDKPVLKPLVDQTIPIASQLTLTAQATFPGKQALKYSLKNAPVGASINEQTGVLTWTPTQLGQFPFTVVVTEPLGQHTDEATFTVTVTSIVTHLNLNLSSLALFQNSELKIKGKLSSYPKQPSGLNNLEIQLALTAPDGQQTTLTTSTAASGEYHLAQPLILTQTGQYVVQTQWLGNEHLAASQSKPQTVLVSALAGYALLVEGRDAQGSGEQAYNKSLNRVYRKLKYRGFLDEHIEYLSYETNPETDIIIDARPDKARIQTALQTLQTLLNNDPAPLFIVMLDHGGADGQFYLDNGDGGTITPTELNTWLTTLEQGLNYQAKAQPRVIIIGACYSGNFIPTLSQPGRVIVTSTAVGEESYKGPKEPDEVRSGEYFIEALFAPLGRGDSLASAFDLATYSTENFTRKDDFTYFNEQFQDHAMQHPLLDDNGDRQGSNWLGNDGQQAKHIYLGLGLQYDANAPDSPTAILAVTPTLHLDANTAVAQLSAWINHPNRVKDQQVWVDIRPPSLQLTGNGIEQSGQLEIGGLKRIQLTLAAGNHFQGQFAAFTEAGQYELFYFVIDNQTGEISPLKHSSVYKDKLGNQSPTVVQLRVPANGSETSTVVVFDWEASQDPDADPVTYTLLLGTDPDLKTSIYQQADLATSMTYLDATAVINDPLNQGQPGLRDGTQYFWKVQAIDKYGAMAESPIFAFQTNDTNFPPGLGSLYVYNAVDFVSLENATLNFWVVDEWGNLVLDANGLPIPIAQPPDIYQDQGFYDMTLPYGRRRATVRATGYQEQEVLIDTTDGLANLHVAMTPTGGIAAQPGQLQFRVAQARFEETQGQIAILVDRVGGADGAVAVSYQILATSSATLGTDYSGATTGQLSWADQDTAPKKIVLTIQDDNQAEPEENIQLHLHDPTGGAILGTQAEMTITLIDDETTLPQQPGVLQFLTMHYTASESESQPVITVTRTGGDDGQVTVEYLVTNQSTAQLNTDYTGGTGVLTWASGDNEPKRLQLNLIDDNVVEPLETLVIELVNPTKGATLGEHQSATLTITDNDVAGAGAGTVQFAQSNYQAHEEEGTLKTVTVTRTGGSQGQVSVQYQTTAASTATAESDYHGGTGTLTWKDGDSEAKVINLTIVDDPTIETAETIQLMLLNPSGGAVLGNPSQATLTISDNDGNKSTGPVDKTTTDASGNPTTSTSSVLIDSATPTDSTTNAGTSTTNVDSTTNAGTLQFATNTYYLNEGIGAVSTFTVTRTGGKQGAVSVKYTTTTVGTADIGLDYVGGSGLLTWADGDDTPKAIEIQIIDDSQSEGPETIQLQLENPTGHAQLGIDDHAILIIVDNDTADTDIDTNQADFAILQFESALHWIQEEDGKIDLKVTRTGSSQGEVAVNYLETLHSNATPGEDYLNGSGSLIWADGDNQSQTITLDLIDDDLPETELIHLVLVEPLGQAVLGKQNETLIILQDQDKVNPVQPNGTSSTSSDLTTIQLTKAVEFITESQGEILIPVIRTGTQGLATVDYETMAGSATADEDYLSRQGRLVWQDGEEGLVNLIIPIIVDSQPEPDESFTLRLFNPSEGVQLGNLSQVEIRIQDDSDMLPPPLLLPNLGRGIAIANDPTTQWQTRYNCQALPCPLQAAFRGGISLNGLSYYQQLTLDPYQTVNIRGEIDVAAEHVGQSADLLVVAAWQPLDSDEPARYFMQDDQGQILPWDFNLAHLVAAQTTVTLTPTQELNLYTGLLARGQIHLFFGYQLSDGVIVFNGEQAVDLVVGK